MYGPGCLILHTDCRHHFVFCETKPYVRCPRLSLRSRRRLCAFSDSASCSICIDVLVALMRLEKAFNAPEKAFNAPGKGIRKSIYVCFSPRENILPHKKNLRHFADTKHRRFFSESLQHYLAGKSNCSSFNAPHSSSWATYWMKCAVCLWASRAS